MDRLSGPDTPYSCAEEAEAVLCSRADLASEGAHFSAVLIEPVTDMAGVTVTAQCATAGNDDLEVLFGPGGASVVLLCADAAGEVWRFSIVERLREDMASADLSVTDVAREVTALLSLRGTGD